MERTDKSGSGVVRKDFVEPTVSAPMELPPAARAPMMPLAVVSGGGPSSFDGSGTTPPPGDGSGLDVGGDLGFGPGTDGGGID